MLKQDEIVHHANGVKHDNRPENLAVMGALDPAALSARDYRDGVAARLRQLEEYERRFGPLSQES